MVATDLQGNLRDFLRLEAIFEQRMAQRPDVYFVITGDLVHGPELAPDDWPEHLGSYYLGQSDHVLEHARLLQDRYPGHVHYLLGNHEHAHLGGPVVGKFFRDEAARLESILGPDRTAYIRDWMETWPLVAVASSAQLCMLHAAPAALIHTRADVDNIELHELEGTSSTDTAARSVLGAILWARATTYKRAQSFMRAIDPAVVTAIHGHDVAREGVAIDQPNCLCLSTSFGCYDGDKLYLEWELSQPVESAEDLLFSGGLRKLWPAEPSVYLDERVR